MPLNNRETKFTPEMEKLLAKSLEMTGERLKEMAKTFHAGGVVTGRLGKSLHTAGLASSPRMAGKSFDMIIVDEYSAIDEMLTKAATKHVEKIMAADKTLAGARDTPATSVTTKLPPAAPSALTMEDLKRLGEEVRKHAGSTLGFPLLTPPAPPEWTTKTMPSRHWPAFPYIATTSEEEEMRRKGKSLTNEERAERRKQLAAEMAAQAANSQAAKDAIVAENAAITERLVQENPEFGTW